VCLLSAFSFILRCFPPLLTSEFEARLEENASGQRADLSVVGMAWTLNCSTPSSRPSQDRDDFRNRVLGARSWADEIKTIATGKVKQSVEIGGFA
jgi:hypothetical protein